MDPIDGGDASCSLVHLSQLPLPPRRWLHWSHEWRHLEYRMPHAWGTAAPHGGRYLTLSVCATWEPNMNMEVIVQLNVILLLITSQRTAV